MSRVAAMLTVLALVQLAAPAPATASVMMVPGCGPGNASVALTIPIKRAPGDPENSPCCGKLCHVNDRKRLSGQCCGPEDESDDA